MLRANEMDAMEYSRTLTCIDSSLFWGERTRKVHLKMNRDTVTEIDGQHVTFQVSTQNAHMTLVQAKPNIYRFMLRNTKTMLGGRIYQVSKGSELDFWFTRLSRLQKCDCETREHSFVSFRESEDLGPCYLKKESSLFEFGDLIDEYEYSEGASTLSDTVEYSEADIPKSIMTPEVDNVCFLDQSIKLTVDNVCFLVQSMTPPADNVCFLDQSMTPPADNVCFLDQSIKLTVDNGKESVDLNDVKWANFYQNESLQSIRSNSSIGTDANDHLCEFIRYRHGNCVDRIKYLEEIEAHSLKLLDGLHCLMQRASLK